MPILLLLLLAAALLFSCESVSQPKPHKGRLVTIADCRPEVMLNKGDSLQVLLTQYPGRGYTWSLKNADRYKGRLRFVGTFLQKPGNDLDDSKQTAGFLFVARGKSASRLRFEYRRPWEPGVKGADSCRIGVVVK